MWADIILPSLDAGDVKLFRHVNRPHRDVVFDEMVEGMVSFAKNFGGRIWLEVFLLGGITGIETEVSRIAALAARICPDRIHLNTVHRPPAENFAIPVGSDALENFAILFTPKAEVISEFKKKTISSDGFANTEAVLGLLSRRPCSLKDVSEGLCISPVEAIKLLEELEHQGKIREMSVGRRRFYGAIDNMVN
jgi:wyosine [tRNA(Phe)-imidazoG37] synthetase (radical SAM superfamily)